MSNSNAQPTKRLAPFDLVVVIAASAVALIQLIISIQNIVDMDPKLLWPIGEAISLMLVALITILLVLKGKGLLANLLLLFVPVVDRGLVFFRDVFNDTSDFSNFAGFSSLLYLLILVALIIVLVFQVKELKGTCPFVKDKPTMMIYLLIVAGIILFFNTLAALVFVAVIVALFVLFGEQRFIPLYIATIFASAPFRIIDYFILENSNMVVRGMYPFGWWVQMIVYLAALTVSIILYFVPNLFGGKPKEISTQVQDAPENSSEEAPAERDVEEVVVEETEVSQAE